MIALLKMPVINIKAMGSMTEKRYTHTRAIFALLKIVVIDIKAMGSTAEKKVHTHTQSLLC